MKPRKSYSLEFKAKLIGIYESWQVYEGKEEKSIDKMAAITGIDRRVLGPSSSSFSRNVVRDRLKKFTQETHVLPVTKTTRQETYVKLGPPTSATPTAPPKNVKAELTQADVEPTPAQAQNTTAPKRGRPPGSKNKPNQESVAKKAKLK